MPIGTRLSFGSTHDSNLTRDELIALAYEDIKVLAEGEPLSAELLETGIKKLNLIIREHDAALKHPWAVATEPTDLLLIADQFSYTVLDSLPETILELVTVSYRDASNTDWPIKILTIQQYEANPTKEETGPPQWVYLSDAREPIDKVLHIGPMLSALDATTPERLRLWFKRPLYDFDSATDNPDLPQAWVHWLQQELAIRLSPGHNVTLEKVNLMRSLRNESYEKVFRSVQPVTTEIHDKVQYF
jgi:hypothetical protein